MSSLKFRLHLPTNKTVHNDHNDNKYLFADVDIEDVKKVIEQRRFEFEAFGLEPELVLHFIMCNGYFK